MLNTGVLSEIIKKVTTNPAIPANLLTSIRTVTIYSKIHVSTTGYKSIVVRLGLASSLLFSEFDRACQAMALV